MLSHILRMKAYTSVRLVEYVEKILALIIAETLIKQEFWKVVYKLLANSENVYHKSSQHKCDIFECLILFNQQ